MTEENNIFITDKKNAKNVLTQFFSSQLSDSFDSIIAEYKNGQQIIDDIKDKNNSNIITQIQINNNLIGQRFTLFHGILIQIFEKHNYCIGASLAIDILKDRNQNIQIHPIVDANKKCQLLFGPNDNDKISKIIMFWFTTNTNKTIEIVFLTQKVSDFVMRYKIFPHPPLENLVKISKNRLFATQIARSFTIPFGSPLDGWNGDKNVIYHYKLTIENGTAGFGLCGPTWNSWNKSIDIRSIYRKYDGEFKHCDKYQGDNPMETWIIKNKKDIKSQNEFEKLNEEETQFRLWQQKRIKNRKDPNCYSFFYNDKNALKQEFKKNNIGDGIVAYWRNGWYINSFLDERCHIGNFYSLHKTTEITIIMDFKAYLCRICSSENEKKQILFDLTCFNHTIQMLFSFDKGRYGNVHVSIRQQFVQQ